MKNNSSLWNILSVLIAVVLSLGSTYGMLITSDVSSTVQIENIKECIKDIQPIKEKVNLHSQQIGYHEELVNKEIENLKFTVAQLQKNVNILTVQVSDVIESNKKVLNVLENLNTSINGLNVTIGRIDERLKNLERKK